MRDKMVKVGVAATVVALAAGVSGAFGGVALAGGEHGEVVIGGNGGNGGNASADCGVSAEIPIIAPILGLDKFAPQCDANGGAGGQGGRASDN
jgi:hypothetical protein